MLKIFELMIKIYHSQDKRDQAIIGLMVINLMLIININIHIKKFLAFIIYSLKLLLFFLILEKNDIYIINLKDITFMLLNV